MTVTPDEVRDRIGCEPFAEFEVSRVTDSEKLRCDPESVLYGSAHHPREECGPMVIFEYNKYTSGLPPWNQLIAFTLEGDESAAEFAAPVHLETAITGDLKTVHLAVGAVRFLKENDFKLQ